MNNSHNFLSLATEKKKKKKVSYLPQYILMYALIKIKADQITVSVLGNSFKNNLSRLLS